jgi:elongation factor P
MLNYNEIKRGKVIEYEGEPFKVMSNWIVKKNRNKPTNQTKLKSLVSGKNIEVTFHAKDKVEEAYIEKKDLKYLYQKGNEVWFCAADNPADRFNLDLEMVEDDIKFLKGNDIVRGEYFDGELIGLSLPPKVTLKVKEAPDAVAGNTSSGATKKVILENGLEVFTPLFIKEGEEIVINTETGEYSERAK